MMFIGPSMVALSLGSQTGRDVGRYKQSRRHSDRKMADALSI
jgi:hypothetical protein